MKEYNFLIYSSLVLFLSSCVSSSSIYSLCEKDDKGNYVVKWEISPDPQKGNVEIFSSSNDNLFNDKKTPLLITNVEDRIATFQCGSLNVRDFFLLKANNSYSGIITNRHISFDIIQNFRDLGGYFNDDNKQLRWGKLFRSGSLFQITKRDIHTLEKLGIKSVIDLRSKKESYAYPDDYLGATHFNIEIDTLNSFELEKKIASRTFYKGDAMIYMQDAYRSILENNNHQLKELFNILLNEKNYPVLIHDNLGKDRVGVVSYMILSALDIEPNDLMYDYMLSNNYINLEDYSRVMQQMPEAMQEATTVAVRADEDYFEYAIDFINKKYGNMDLYLEKALGMNSARRAQLKKIMCY